ncbi:hypothetical protein GIW82_12050 [Planomicrobium sp. YIM 101495]|nr:hypothetical protein [Planomicrobium sp. YIM 101495]
MNYVILAIGCAVPFALFVFIGGKEAATRQALIISAALFAVLFAAVHAIMAVSTEAMETETAIRVLIVFPSTALILLLALRLAASKEKAA